MKLDLSYYQKNDVVSLAKDLIGKVICTYINEQFTSGIIIETEAYAGTTDRACHAYNGKRTSKNEVMYHDGGKAYIYLCYGIHYLFNVVTNIAGIPEAVLIRGIYPLEGLEVILKRRNIENFHFHLAFGPGKVTQALGITILQNGIDLSQNTIWIENRGIFIPSEVIQVGQRIGVAYAKEDAFLPYRFWVEPKICSEYLKNCYKSIIGGKQANE
jgi:DNA-3-methyladenine glycosylase